MSMAIRVVYIVPGDAAPWRDARHRATEWLEDVQWFFADEMARLGYGPRTFEIHYTDGAVRFDELNIVNARSEFLSSGRGTPALCLDGARTLAPPGNEDIVVYIHEAYEIRPREVCAPSRGSGRMRAAFLSSLHLKLARREWMSKDDGHAGAVMEWVAPDPMPDLPLLEPSRQHVCRPLWRGLRGDDSRTRSRAWATPRLGRNRRPNAHGAWVAANERLLPAPPR